MFSITRFFKAQQSNAQRLMSTSLRFIRHAQSTWNEKPERVQGQSRDPSIVLSANGVASIKAGLLASVPKPDVIISSPLERCIQTARLGLGRSPDVIVNDLAEINAGIYEGLEIEAIRQDPGWRHWMTDPLSFPGFPGGESLTSFSNRVMDAVRLICASYADSNLHVCVISHGVVLRVLKCHLAGQDLSKLWMHQVPNGEQVLLTESQIASFQQQYRGHLTSMFDTKPC